MAGFNVTFKGYGEVSKYETGGILFGLESDISVSGRRWVFLMVVMGRGISRRDISSLEGY